MNPPRLRSGTQPRSSPPTDRPSRPRSLRRAGLFFAFPREDVEPGTETRPSCRARVACPAIVILLGLSVGQAQSAARVISAQSRRGAVALAQADPKGSSGVGTAPANPGAAKAPARRTQERRAEIGSRGQTLVRRRVPPRSRRPDHWLRLVSIRTVSLSNSAACHVSGGKWNTLPGPNG